MVEPTRGGVVDGGAPQAPPGLDTRERDSGLLTTIGWDLPPLVGM